VRSYLARKSAVAGRTLTVFDVVGSTLTSLSVLGDVQTHFTQTEHTSTQRVNQLSIILALVICQSCDLSVASKSFGEKSDFRP